ncbi:MAG TPA: peptidase, partial [Nannocystis exedens]|nr:peptidase [Nannocystis exedens]
ARPDRAQNFRLNREAAISYAINDLYGPLLSADQLVPAARVAAEANVGAGFFQVAADAGPHALNLRLPALAKPVYFPLQGGLVPAFLVETQVYNNSDLDGTQHVIAADDGRVLYRRSLKAHEAYSYRVWADAEGDHRPADGPMIDFTPHPTGTPGDGPIDETKPNLISIDGFNTNPDGESDPWLPAGSTESLGNNVDAYVDHLGPSGFNPEDGEFRAATNEALTFDYNYDLSAEPLASTDQSMAATVQLFYDINWLHDYWYDSGFNEAAGNAQDDNYGRGGAGGDRLQAQAQDGALTGSRNNANMMTPSDGVSPVMQMYLWSPRDNTATLTLAPGDQTYEVTKGQFSPTNYDLSGPMVLIDDGEGMSFTDGCEPPQNDVSGKVVAIDRGDCTFETKANGAEMMGAIAVVIIDNVEGNAPPGLGNDADMEDPTIPVQAVTKADGAMIKEALMQGNVTATLTGEAGVELDGTIDNQIVAHEWGHYIHHRLVDCGNAQCSAMSEGWGDFIALHQTLREGDDLDGTYASQTYAGFDASGYFGIRRVPYSVDMTKDPLTFGHISATATLPQIEAIMPGGPNNQVHNAGEIWATMMWEVYIALHKAHAGDMSFGEIRRRLSDYVVAGMILSPPVPTYTEQRDAILLAISQFDDDDFTTAAQAFARRGAGTCAISPERDSVDFVGVVESFELRANATITGLAVNENKNESCDDDGVIDGGETGTIAIQIYNNGVKDLEAGATLEIISKSGTLLFPEGPSQSLPAIPRLEKISTSFKVAVGEGQSDVEFLNLVVRLTTPDGCKENFEIKLPLVIHGDINPESSATDDVEVPDSPWLIEGTAGDLAWQREATESSGSLWRGRDLGSISDTSLISPPLEVTEDEPLVIAFEHAFKFEYGDNIAWDGGVLEISDDQGESWTDVAAFVDPGY